MEHKHKVNETRVRSLLKTASARTLEIVVDTLIVGSIYNFFEIPHAYELAAGISVLIEVLCALVNYINERLWNKVQWGREVVDIGG